MVCKRSTGASLVGSDIATEYFFTVLLPNAYVSKFRTCRKYKRYENKHIEKFL